MALWLKRVGRTHWLYAKALINDNQMHPVAPVQSGWTKRWKGGGQLSDGELGSATALGSQCRVTYQFPCATAGAEVLVLVTALVLTVATSLVCRLDPDTL